MKKCRSYFFLVLGILLILALAPLSVHAEDAAGNGSSISDWEYTDNSDGSITLTKYIGASKDVVIPGKLDGKQVKIASFKAFQSNGAKEWRSLVVGTPDEKVVCENADALIGAFAGSKLENVDLSGLDTSNVTSMGSMFYSCDKLVKLDLSNLDTSKVTSMSSMFSYCSRLKELDVSSFNTSCVTSMYRMFADSSGLQKLKLDVSKFETSNVTNMEYMFSGCSALKELDVSKFDTSNVTNMGYMFSGCRGLKELDVSDFNISNVTSMNNMFQDCSELTKLDVSKFDTSKVTSMSMMFLNCSKLQELDVSSFNTSNVRGMGSMFSGCSGLTKLDVSKFDTSKVISMGHMFSGCSALKELDVSKFDTSKVEWMEAMFASCSGLKELDVKNFDTSNVTNMYSMFKNCSGLKELDIRHFKTSKVYNMSGMFSGCSGLKDLDIRNFDTSNVTQMHVMFSGCSGLKELDVSNFNTSKAKAMGDMFSGCSGLTKLDLSNFDTSKVDGMYYMFKNCSGLKELDLSNFDTSKVGYMMGMFDGCSGLQELDVSNFNTSKVTRMESMFSGCSSLKELDVSNFNTSNVTNMDSMFTDCSKLQLLNCSVEQFFKKGSKVFDTHTSGNLPTAIITQCDDVKSYSPDAGKTIGNERVPYTATVKLDANGGAFAEKATDGEKTITLGSNNIFYDTVDAYTQEFTITKDRLATLTESPKRKGFLFTDWYLDKECTKPFTSKVLTLGNDNEVTLYAGYEKIVLKDRTIKINPIAERPYDGKPTSLTADNCTVDGSKENITFTYEQKIGNAWEKLARAPVNAGTYRVKATVAEDDTYASAESEYVEFTIKKATPKYEVPKGLEAIEGQTLADVKLPQGFTWDKDATTSVGASGKQEFTVTYTPDDTDNFEVVKDIKVTIKVHMKWVALNEIPVITATDKTLTEGDKFDPKEGVTASDKEDGDLTDQIEIAKNTVDISKAGLYSVTYKVTDKGGASAEKSINVVVKEKTAPPTTVSQDGSANGSKTGDTMPIGMLAVLMLVAAAGIAFCGRKLYKSR